MFNSLTQSLSRIFSGLRGKGVLNEEDISIAMREIRVALIEADVPLAVIKHLIERVKTRAIGAEVLNSISPGQMIAKIVQDEITEILKSDDQGLSLNHPAPVVILMIGLQGAGKTTTAAKIAMRLHKKHKKVLLASADVSRPAAQKQLEVLGQQVDVATLPISPNQKPIDIVNKAISEAKSGHFDVLIIDTAGRISIDEELMKELQEMYKIAKPHEVLLVVDCMIGQESINIAQSFQSRVPLTGIVMTKVDGDARGGAALSMKYVTNCPIKLIGVGEKMSELEEFNPKSIASRILGMSDTVAFVEKMAEVVDVAKDDQLLKKLQKNGFDMNDLLSQIKKMNTMGGVGSLVAMMPGLGKYKQTPQEAEYLALALKRQQAIIQSMTEEERRNPLIINASRKHRIAKGSGTSVADINRLLKQHLGISKAIKKVSQMRPSFLKKFGSKFM